jgi:hypothetical protein
MMPRLLVLLVVTMLLPVHATEGDDGTVLLQGMFRGAADARFSLPITKRFTSSGGTEDLATDFNRDLNSAVFRALRLMEAAFRHIGTAAR